MSEQLVAMKRDALRALADQGRAAGLEAAAEVMLAMADHKRRVVGTGELKMAAAALKENAAEVRARADRVLKALGEQR